MFDLGGNSIATIKVVVSQAREASLEFGAINIFAHPELQDLVRILV